MTDFDEFGRREHDPRDIPPLDAEPSDNIKPDDDLEPDDELGPDEPPGEPVVANRPFDPASFNQQREFTRVEDWRPGEKVRIVTPQAPAAVLIFWTLMGAVAAGLAGAFPIWSVIEDFIGGDADERWATTACVALFGGALAGFWLRNNLQSREFVFDWLKKLATRRVGAVEESWTLSEIQGLVLREICIIRKDKPDEYRHRLRMLAPGGGAPIIESEQSSPTAAASYEQLAPFAAELAAALGTSCTLLKFGADFDLFEKLRLTGLQKIVLGAMGVAMAVLLVAAAVPQQNDNRAAQRLREGGLDISQWGRFERNDDLIGENFWSVTVKAGQSLPPLDEEAKRLLASLRKVGLDADKSMLTDDDLLALEGVKWSIVDLSQTPITDRGIAAIAASDELTYLDAYDTSAGDEAMAALARSPKLRFLFLPGARVTDAGLKHLASIRTLKTVHLGACPVTEAGVEALRRALPDAEVIFK